MATAAAPTATAPALKTFGPPSPTPAPAAAPNNTNFSWLGIDSADSYYKAMQRPMASGMSSAAPSAPAIAPPKAVAPPAVSKLDAHTIGSAGMGSSQEGATLMSSPAKLGKAVEALAAVPKGQKMSYADSLSGETLKAYTARLEAINSRGFGGQVAKEMFDMGTDATVKPVKQVSAWLTGTTGDQEDRDMMTHINALMTQKKYALARAELDSYGVRKINSMSDHDLLSLDAEHPLVANMAHQAGVFTIQFSLLRNAPFLKQLGDQMAVGAGKGILAGMEASPSVASAVSSPVGMGFARLAVQLAGDIPAQTVIPALNFDYANRPISELPKETLNNLALMVPMAIGFHVAGMGIGATMKGFGINMPVTSGPDFADMVPNTDVNTIKAATKVMGVAQALRLPINKSAGKALEAAAMDEGDNAFTRILNALPEEKSILAEHFKAVRMAIDSENRMLAFSSTSPQFSTPFGENRMIGKTGAGDGLSSGPAGNADDAIRAAGGNIDDVNLGAADPVGMADSKLMNSFIGKGSTPELAAKTVNALKPLIEEAKTFDNFDDFYKSVNGKSFRVNIDSLTLPEGIEKEAFAKGYAKYPKPKVDGIPLTITMENGAMQIDDGVHRLAAALRRGETQIDVKFEYDRPSASFLFDSAKSSIPHVPPAVTPTVMPSRVFEKTSATAGITPDEDGFITRIARNKTSRAAIDRLTTSVAVRQDNPVIIQMKEMTALKAQLRAEVNAAYDAFVSTKSDIKEVQTRLTELINDSIPSKKRGGVLSLIKGVQNESTLAKAVSKVNSLIDNLKLQELGVGAKGNSIKRGVRAGIKDLFINPVPELDIVQPPMRSIWFKNILDNLAPEWKVGTKGGQAATGFMQKIVDQLEPVRNLKGTYNLLKAFPKAVSQKTTMAWQELGDIYNRNLSNIEEVNQLHKYEILLQMKSRAELGLSNPGSKELGIPNNLPAADLQTMIDMVETPTLKNVHAQLKKWDAKNILNTLVESARITPQVAKEWMQKYPDHISFMYEKYMQKGDGLPGKSFDYTARDYLKPIKGGADLNVNSNLFDVRMRSASRAISDLHADEVAGTLRKELGVSPVKVTELPNGKRSYSALSNGQVLEFDANDLIANQVPELKGQRILYSQFDKQAYLVPETIYNTIKNIHPKIGPIQRTFARMTSLWRDLTTTYNPAFAVVTNPSRDIQNAILLTDHSARDFLGAYMQTARDIIADGLYRDPKMAPDVSASLMGAVAKEAQAAKNWVAKKIGTEGFQSFMDTFKESGGAQGGYYAFRSSIPGEEISGLGALKKWVTGSSEQFSLAKVNTKFIGNTVIRTGVKGVNAVSMPFQSIRELGEFFEKLPRGAEFRLSLAKTGDASEAAAKASDITVDFHKSGEWFKQIKNLFPFSNANLQGNVNLLSAAVGNKSVGGMNKVAGAALFGARAIGSIIAPSVGLWWLRKQMGVEDTTDAQTKANYYVIPTGMTYLDEFGQQLPVTVTVRKGEAAQYLTPPIESMLNYFYSQDPSAFNGLKASTITQKLMSSLTAFIRVPIEVETNHSFYYQQPIVPVNMQNKPTELQNFRNTSYLGKKLGDALGISGIEGDYVIKNLAPAVYKYYTAIGKPTDKNALMMLGNLFSIIQTPTIYFEDQALQKQQKDVIDQMKQVGRARYATPEERTTAIQRLLKAAQDLQTQIRARVRIRQENPLQPNPVNPDQQLQQGSFQTP